MVGKRKSRFLSSSEDSSVNSGPEKRRKLGSVAGKRLPKIQKVKGAQIKPVQESFLKNIIDDSAVTLKEVKRTAKTIKEKDQRYKTVRARQSAPDDENPEGGEGERAAPIHRHLPEPGKPHCRGDGELPYVPDPPPNPSIKKLDVSSNFEFKDNISLLPQPSFDRETAIKAICWFSKLRAPPRKFADPFSTPPREREENKVENWLGKMVDDYQGLEFPGTPECPGTPARSFGDPNMTIRTTFATPVTFSPHRSQILNATLISNSSTDSDSGNQSLFVYDVMDQAEREKLEKSFDWLNMSGAKLNETFVEQLQNQLEENALDETMDWDEIDPRILQEINVCRLELQGGTPLSQTSQEFLKLGLERDCLRYAGEKIFLVTDTNIFIAQLSQVEKVMNKEKMSQVIIYIPWAVTRELDALKDFGRRNRDPNEDLETKARKAISFIHQQLKDKNPMICGQTGEQEREAEVYLAHNADDRILQACLKLRAEGKNVLLYTNDKNLANKAMISQIEAFNSVGILKGLEAKLKFVLKEDGAHLGSSESADEPMEMEEDKVEDVRPANFRNEFQTSLQRCLKKVFVDELKDSYGDTWERMVAKPKNGQDWTLIELFKIIFKIWRAVFSINWKRGATKDILKKLEGFTSKSERGWKITKNREKLNAIQNVEKFLTIIKERSTYDGLLDVTFDDMKYLRKVIGQGKDTAAEGQESNPPAAEIGLPLEGMNGLKDLFQEVWQTIWKYTCSYSSGLEIRLASGIAAPRPEDLSGLKRMSYEETETHMDLLLSLVIRLAQKMESLLKLSPQHLSVTNRMLSDFHSELTSFLLKLDSNLSDKNKTFPLIHPKVLVDFLVHPESRNLVDIGYGQLCAFRSQLTNCQEKFKRSKL